MASRTPKICYRCMKEISAESCPYCGFERQYYGVPAQHLKPGTLLRGRYLLGVSVGSGGFGITYIARDQTLEMTVAVKELFLRSICSRGSDGRVIVPPEQRACFLETRKQFLREARVLAKFQGDAYRAMVTVREHFEERNTAYLVMDYLEGRTLRELVRERRFKLPELVTLLTPVAEILTEVHKYHIVHRDVSPDNILLQEDGRAYLLDFGGAAQLGAEDCSPVLSFKKGYTPPEQYVAGARLGSWTDVYALAATVLFCLTGERPDEKVLPGSAREHLPERVQKVLARGMEPEVVRRYQTVEEFWRELRRLGRPRLSLTGRLVLLGSVLGAAAVCAVLLYPRLHRESWYAWQEGTYVLVSAEHPEVHLGVPEGRSDNGSTLALLAGEIHNSDRLRLTPCEGDPELAVFAFAHTGSYVQHAETAEGLVQMEEALAEPLRLRARVLSENDDGEPLLALADESSRWLTPEEPLLWDAEPPDAAWLLRSTEADPEEPRRPVYHVGEQQPGMAGIWCLRSALDSRCLTALPSLMEEPPELLLLPDTSDGGRRFALSEQESGVYTLRADAQRVGPEGVLKLDPEEDRLYLGSPTDGSPERFRLRYAGQDTWVLVSSDGRRLAAAEDSEQLTLQFPPREEAEIPASMRWYLETAGEP